MFAKSTELQLLTDPSEINLVEMTPNDIDEVSGGIAWFAIPLAVRIGIGVAGARLVGAAAGYAIGYWARRG